MTARSRRHRPRFGWLIVQVPAPPGGTQGGGTGTDTVVVAPQNAADAATAAVGRAGRVDAAGLSVTASAYELAVVRPRDLGLPSGMDLAGRSATLGLANAGSRDAPLSVEGVVVTDFLVLEFSRPVLLLSFNLRDVDVVTCGGVGVHVGSDPDPAYKQAELAESPTGITLPSPLRGSRFVLAVCGTGTSPESRAAYKVSAVDVTLVPVPNVVRGAGTVVLGLGAYHKVRGGGR